MTFLYIWLFTVILNLCLQKGTLKVMLVLMYSFQTFHDQQLEMSEQTSYWASDPCCNELKRTQLITEPLKLTQQVLPGLGLVASERHLGFPSLWSGQLHASTCTLLLPHTWQAALVELIRCQWVPVQYHTHLWVCTFI